MREQPSIRRGWRGDLFPACFHTGSGPAFTPRNGERPDFGGAPTVQLVRPKLWTRCWALFIPNSLESVVVSQSNSRFRSFDNPGKNHNLLQTHGEGLIKGWSFFRPRFGSIIYQHECARGYCSIYTTMTLLPTVTRNASRYFSIHIITSSLQLVAKITCAIRESRIKYWYEPKIARHYYSTKARVIGRSPMVLPVFGKGPFPKPVGCLWRD